MFIIEFYLGIPIAIIMALIATISCMISMIALCKYSKGRSDADVRRESNTRKEKVKAQEEEEREQVEEDRDEGGVPMNDPTYMEVGLQRISFKMEGNIAYQDNIATRKNEAYEQF